MLQVWVGCGGYGWFVAVFGKAVVFGVFLVAYFVVFGCVWVYFWGVLVCLGEFLIQINTVTSNAEQSIEHINKYFKSAEQTKREKIRRMRVLDLWLKDWGIGRIASDLGVRLLARWSVIWRSLGRRLSVGLVSWARAVTFC